MYARSGLITVSPDKVDDAVRALQEQQLPEYHDQHGYRGFTAPAVTLTRPSAIAECG